ncbi:MAG: hypothetical protein VYC88_10550 [SAR324 cluster bacterium]|nr:hypothetical protein [SAR324 cluster bacterium]
MVLFAIIYRNLRIKIKQEKNDDAPPSPRGPWLRGPWIKLKWSYESLNEAIENFESNKLSLSVDHQFSIVVEQFDLGGPPGDSKARGLHLPYTWMYECCTLSPSGHQNDDQLFHVNPSWMVQYTKRTELDNDWVKHRIVRLQLLNGKLLKTWGHEEGEHQGALAGPEYRPAPY